MMTIPTLPRLLAAATICAALSACGGESTAPSASTVAASAPSESSPTAQNASSVSAGTAVNLPADAPVVTVVTTGKTRPFSYTETDGSVTGLDVDVISKIGEAQGFRVQIHKRPWQNLFTEVETSQYELAISGISYTPERAEKYELSNSYALNPSVLMFTNPDLENKIKDLKSLRNIPNLSVGVLDGSKHMKQMTEAGVGNLKTFKTTYLLFTSLLKGETDVIAQDGLLLRPLAQENPNTKTYTFTYEDEKEPSAQLVILMKKGNTDLLKKVNTGLAKIQANGELEKIHKKWLGDTAKNTPAK